MTPGPGLARGTARTRPTATRAARRRDGRDRPPRSAPSCARRPEQAPSLGATGRHGGEYLGMLPVPVELGLDHLGVRRLPAAHDPALLGHVATVAPLDTQRCENLALARGLNTLEQLVSGVGGGDRPAQPVLERARQ